MIGIWVVWLCCCFVMGICFRFRFFLILCWLVLILSLFMVGLMIFVVGFLGI